MKTVIYEVTVENEDGQWQTFATRREAEAYAREAATWGGDGLDIEVIRCETVDLPLRAFAAKLLNRREWCADSKTVATFKLHARND